MEAAATVDAERLVRDIHPAEVALPNERVIRDARVFITTRRLIVYENTPRGIERTVVLDVAQPCSVPANRGSLRGSLEARLQDGQTVWINKGRGCGCHSPLKALGLPVSWTGE